MIGRCLFCHAALGANQTLECFPVGHRVAYDPARGRLWAVCGACRRWTLAPIEERWEVLEELERLLSGRARMLAQTENIALLEAGDVELVRVGRARLREEAWWRYGTEFSRRRRASRRVVRRGKIVDAGLMFLLTGLPIWAFSNPERWLARERARRFGRTAWRGELVCARCGAARGDLRFEHRDRLVVAPLAPGELTLRAVCAHCDPADDESGHRIRGVPALHLLRRVLAYQNFSGGSEDDVAAAARAIETFDSPAGLTRRIASERIAVGRLAPVSAIALEIAVNEENERRLLEMELEALEARWREEEEIAAIVDGELTPLARPLPGRTSTPATTRTPR